MAATFQHFLHDHPLELMAVRPPTAETFCSACQVPLVSGRHYYSCNTCAFYLHRPCFNLPQLIRHPVDPDHNLNLVHLQSSDCRACRQQGSGLFYNCSVCQVNYHCLCMLVPLKKQHASHPHELMLKFSSPYGKDGFSCDLCDEPALDQWLYRCDDCQFDVHLSCSFTPRAQSSVGAPAIPADYAPSAPVVP